MGERLKRRVAIELGHFHMLGEDVKRLLWSYGLFLAAWPMVVTFINAYLWQQGEAIERLIIYNATFFAGLPVGFWLNRWVLEKMHVLRAYFLGCVLQGLSAFLVVFWPATSLGRLAIYGVVFGLGSALFWGNKSYLTLKLTRGKSRIYYQNIEYVVNLATGLLVPLLVGWALVVGELNGWYSKELAYRGMLVVGMGLLVLSGWVMQKAKVKDFVVKQVFVRNPSITWWRVRVVNVAMYMLDGLLFFLPSVLVLRLLGDEGVLGTVASLAALLSAGASYVVGRKVQIMNAWRVVILGMGIILVGTGFLAWWWGAIGVVIYWALERVGTSFTYNNTFAMTMEAMDQEKDESDKEVQYAYMCETELTFDVGRLLGIGLFLLIWWGWGLEAGMRYSLLLAAVISLTVIGLVKKVSEKVAN